MLFSLKIEHIVFIIFGVVFVIFVGCACYHKLNNKNIHS